MTTRTTITTRTIYGVDKTVAQILTRFSSECVPLYFLSYNGTAPLNRCQMWPLRFFHTMYTIGFTSFFFLFLSLSLRSIQQSRRKSSSFLQTSIQTVPVPLMTTCPLSIRIHSTAVRSLYLLTRSKMTTDKYHTYVLCNYVTKRVESHRDESYLTIYRRSELSFVLSRMRVLVWL